MSDSQTRFVVGNDFPVTSAKAAEAYGATFKLAHIELRQKKPVYASWQLGLAPDEITRRFARPSNIGVILGSPSGGLVDVDLDCPEAIALAPYVLPKTVTFGRPSKPRSHYLYFVDTEMKRAAYTDALVPSDKPCMMVELRANGCQTVFPPSIHVSGETIAFERTGEIRHVSGESLQKRVAFLAFLTQVARLWPKAPGLRHRLGLALLGILIRLKVTPDTAEHLVCAVAELAGDEEAQMRGRAADRTACLIEEDLPASGWATFASLLGADKQAAVDEMKRWLGISPPEPTRNPSGATVPRHQPTRIAAEPVEILVESLIQENNLDRVIDACEALSRLSAHEWMKAKRALKDHYPALNLNDMEKAVGEARKRLSTERPSGGRPTVDLSTGRSHREVLDEITAAFMACNAESKTPLFRQSGGIVTVEADDRGRPKANLLDVVGIRYHMDQALDFTEQKGQNVRTTRLPEHFARDLGFHLPPRLPHLAFITGVPLVRADGSVLETPGYDARTGVLYVTAEGDCPESAPASPSPEERDEALHLLLEDLLGDFPFDGDASRAGALAFLLTPHLRMVVPGPYPLAAVDATKKGTGKGMLTDLAALIATGREAPKMSMPGSDEEMRKQITSTLLGGPTIAVIDNIDRPIRSAALETLTTTGEWSDRLLGASRQITLQNQTVWAATGNNLLPSGDLPRRCYLVRMDSGLSRPSDRTGFRHKNLKGWVLQNRHRLVWALHVLIRAWFDAGEPEASVKPMGSFEAWTRTVGGILEHAGVGGFLSNRDALHEVAEEDGEWEVFFEALYAAYGQKPFLVRELALYIQKATPAATALREAIPLYLLSAGEGSDIKLQMALGNAFKKRRGSRFGTCGYRVEHAGGVRNGAQTWRVTCDAAPDDMTSHPASDEAEPTKVF